METSRPQPAAAAVPVSIIVPVTGDAPQTLRCFEGLAAQGEAVAHEVIIVDDCATGLEELLARVAGDVEIIRSDTRLGLAGATRLGLEHAAGETVVVIRDSAAPCAGWLESLTAALARPSVGLVTSVLVDDETDPVTALAFAARVDDVRRAGGIPAVPDSLVVGALAIALGADGLRTEAVGASRVQATVPAARRTAAAGAQPELTIVIPTLDATCERVRCCVASVREHTDVPYEIVLVDNGSPPQGFSAPVNAGLRASRAPYLVVLNDDVELLAGWWPPLRAALDAGAAVTFPYTVEGPMRTDFAAWCFAMSRSTMSEFQHAPGEFFDPGLVVWYQDTDLLHRLRRAGREPMLVADSQIRHGLSKTVASDDPDLSAWIRSQVVLDRQRFVAKHPDAVLQGHALVA
ncbi:MAG: glycosyltransferase family 2 protein [Solirubrobacteraceae bacterium]